MSSRLGRLLTSVALAATLTGGAVATTAAPAFAGNESCVALVNVVCTGDRLVTISNISVLDKNKIDLDVLSHIIEDNLNKNDVDLAVIVKDTLNNWNILSCLVTINLVAKSC